MNTLKKLKCWWFVVPAIVVATISLSGQDVSSDPLDTDEIWEMSPFEVTAVDDTRYTATDTLAGSRIRTDLQDIASSISVVTSAFLSDTGAKNVQDLLVYTTNTEVGGIYGNYGGVGNTYIDGIAESLIAPNTNTRVRGLDSADNTRDFIQSDVPWDTFNVSRVDLQRGPNSILFGLGSPAGIINSSLNNAELGSTYGSIENRLSSFNSIRFSADYNQIIIEDELAIRVALLDDNTKYRQKPTFNRDSRAYATVRWQPKLFRNGRTTIRGNFEVGEVDANRPRMLPPEDRITPYFDAAAINHQNYDGYFVNQFGIVQGGTPEEGYETNNWIAGSMGNFQMTYNPVLVYSDYNSSAVSSAYQARILTAYGINTEGAIDEGIGGIPYTGNIGISSYSAYARMEGLPGAANGFYKNRSLADDSIFDFFENLIDGDNKREWQNWETWNINIAQTFWSDKIGIELVADHQQYDDGSWANLGFGIPAISVDIRSNLTTYPWVYDGAVPNENANRAYIGAGTQDNGIENYRERFNVRATAYAEIRADDFIHSSRLTEFLGRHVFTGLYSKETYDVESRYFSLYAVDTSYANDFGIIDAEGAGLALSDGARVLDLITYLSDDLSGVSSASGLNLKRVDATPSPSGSIFVDIYDSTWNAPDVDPSAYWFNPAVVPASGESTESENPANYVGWESRSYDVLNALAGDRDELYTTVSRTRKITESTGLTWQGYWWNDNIVTTFGWRHDEQQLRSGNSADQDSNFGYASTNPALDPLDPEVGKTEGESISWGVVAHSPEFIKKKLPWNSNISLSYSSGKNTRVENRYGFDTNPLPNSEGKTEDISVALTMFDNRLRVKATWYETEVSDANIASVTGETTTLGSNTYYLYLLEAWGLASALTDLAGMNGDAPGSESYWNWAYVDGGWDWNTYADPTSEAFLNSESTAQEIAAVNDFLGQLLPQEWWDGFGFDVDVVAAAAGNYHNAIANWTPGSIGSVQSSGGGKINGVWPVGTVDNESKGVEIEISGEPIRGLNLTLNVAKTDASQTSLGEELSEFIELAHEKWSGPAGDLRLWYGGDRGIGEYFQENIWAAYQFQLETNGRMVAEIAPWKANFVTNYEFQDGAMKGANVGFAYRWEDKHILGYELNEEEDNLDIDKPYWSDTYEHLDLWVGYERQLTDKIKWRIQMNLRNVGEDIDLVPLSVQPDGTPAQFRIQEGMTWSLTNTFSF